MEKLLLEDFPLANDFGSEVIPGAKDLGMHIQAYLFDGYWEDIGTIKAFYEANLNLCEDTPNFSFYDRKVKSSPVCLCDLAGISRIPAGVLLILQSVVATVSETKELKKRDGAML